MSELLANDVRLQYEKSFATIRGIVEIFPDDQWLVPHGDEYYIPSRIAYHLAEFIDGQIAGGFRDPDFASKLPFGSWFKGTAETLPGRSELLSYFNDAVARAQKTLAALDDAGLAAPIEPDRTRMGASQMGVHMYMMRELSAHAGELNKMLIENGKDDVWVSR